MKIKNILIPIIVLLFCTPCTTSAYLHDRGYGLIYDDVQDITWLQDANLPHTSGYDDDGLMTAPEAIAWAENLVYRGYSDWRLPDARNSDGSDPNYGWRMKTNEMGHLFYVELGNSATMDVFDLSGLDNAGPFENLAPFRYWSNTPYYLSPEFWWYFNFGNGFQWDAFSGAQCYVWAVRDGDVSTVPIPSTILLLAWALGSAVLVKKQTIHRLHR